MEYQDGVEAKVGDIIELLPGQFFNVKARARAKVPICTITFILTIIITITIVIIHLPAPQPQLNYAFHVQCTIQKSNITGDWKATFITNGKLSHENNLSVAVLENHYDEIFFNTPLSVGETADFKYINVGNMAYLDAGDIIIFKASSNNVKSGYWFQIWKNGNPVSTKWELQ